MHECKQKNLLIRGDSYAMVTLRGPVSAAFGVHFVRLNGTSPHAGHDHVAIAIGVSKTV